MQFIPIDLYTFSHHVSYSRVGNDTAIQWTDYKSQKPARPLAIPPLSSSPILSDTSTALILAPKYLWKPPISLHLYPHCLPSPRFPSAVFSSGNFGWLLSITTHQPGHFRRHHLRIAMLTFLKLETIKWIFSPALSTPFSEHISQFGHPRRKVALGELRNAPKKLQQHSGARKPCNSWECVCVCVFLIFTLCLTHSKYLILKN